MLIFAALQSAFDSISTGMFAIQLLAQAQEAKRMLRGWDPSQTVLSSQWSFTTNQLVSKQPIKKA